MKYIVTLNKVTAELPTLSLESIVWVFLLFCCPDFDVGSQNIASESLFFFFSFCMCVSLYSVSLMPLDFATQKYHDEKVEAWAKLLLLLLLLHMIYVSWILKKGRQNNTRYYVYADSLEVLFRCRWGVWADPMHAMDTGWHCSGSGLAKRGPVTVECLWCSATVYPRRRLQVWLFYFIEGGEKREGGERERECVCVCVWGVYMCERERLIEWLVACHWLNVCVCVLVFVCACMHECVCVYLCAIDSFRVEFFWSTGLAGKLNFGLFLTWKVFKIILFCVCVCVCVCICVRHVFICVVCGFFHLENLRCASSCLDLGIFFLQTYWMLYNCLTYSLLTAHWSDIYLSWICNCMQSDY